MWDERSGTRERLFLLARLEEGGTLARLQDKDPSYWIYNAVSDRWSNGVIGYKVTQHAEASLAELAHRGITKDQAFDLIWNPGEERIAPTGVRG